VTPSPRLQLPTLGPILRGAGNGARRFPLTIVAAVVAALAAFLAVEEIGSEDLHARLLLTATLGLPLFTGLRLLAGSWRWGAGARWGVDALGVAGLVAFYVAWPHWPEPLQAARYFQVSAALHLFVAFAPFVGSAEGPGFWEYNRLLFERILAAAILTVVLYAGLAIALLALDQLFGVDVPETGYLRLWAVIAFVFTTWFFVADLPDDARGLDTERDYPPGLKVFTRFALLPIVAMYLLILTVYFAKVLVTWQWPSGWIGWLVSAVAVVGIFSLLLVHPAADDPGDRWVRAYARGFFVFLLPAIVMLWLAIWQRVAQYGITERRYFLLVLSIWLAGIAVYQLLTRAKGIRIIPASLCAVAVLTFAGPWGAYRVSERSQVHRLADIFERHGLLVEGRVRPAAGDAVPFEERREVAAILRYLAETHGYSAIAPWFGDTLAAIDTAGMGRRRSATRRAQAVARWLNVEYVEAGRSEGEAPFRFAASDAVGPVPVAGYDVLLRVTEWRAGPAVPPVGWAVRGVRPGASLVVYRDGAVVLRFAVDSLVRRLRALPETPADSVPADSLRLRVRGEGMESVLHVRTMSGRVVGDSVRILSFAGEVLIRGSARPR